MPELVVPEPDVPELDLSAGSTGTTGTTGTTVVPELDVPEPDEPELEPELDGELLLDVPLPEPELPEVPELDGIELLDAPLPDEPPDVPEVEELGLEVVEPELDVPELPAPDDPDEPGGLVSVLDVPEPDLSAGSAGTTGTTGTTVVPEPDVPALDVLELGGVELELELGGVELELELGVLVSALPELLVAEPVELEGVLPVVVLLCSSDLPQPANNTLSTPAARMIFVV